MQNPRYYRLHRAVRDIQTWGLMERASDDPMTRSLVANELTLDPSQPLPRPEDIFSVADQVAELAAEHGLDPDRMNQVIEYCRVIVRNELPPVDYSQLVGVHLDRLMADFRV